MSDSNDTPKEQLQQDVETLAGFLEHLDESIRASRRLQGHTETCGPVKNISPVGMARDLGELANTLVNVRVMLKTNVFSEARPTGKNINIYIKG